MRETVQRLVEHLCGTSEFNSDAAYDNIENNVQNYDWVKRLLNFVEDLDTQAKGQQTCGNCDEKFYPQGSEAHTEGFCCEHCLNQHRGDDCPDDCEFCKDP